MAKRPRPRWLPPIKPKSRASSKRLASVSHEALRRASPAENVKMGFTATARRYVRADAKVTKRTPSVSAGMYETKRVRKVYGVRTREQATREREANNLPYSSPRAAATARKSRDAAYLKRLHKAGEDHRRIVGESGRGKNKPSRPRLKGFLGPKNYASASSTGVSSRT